MLPLIPYKPISINTSLTEDEAVHLVSAAIAPPRSFFQGVLATRFIRSLSR